MYKKAAVLSGRTFLTSLVTDQHIFADEIDKFHFLKTLKGILDPPGYRGIAFVLTDSELHLLMPALYSVRIHKATYHVLRQSFCIDQLYPAYLLTEFEYDHQPHWVMYY